MNFNKFIELLKETNKKNILDINPENGEFSQAALGLEGIVLAIGPDHNDKIIELQKHDRFKFVKKDFNKICFDSIGRPDGIFVSHVIERLNNPFDFLESCNYILTENGLMCITISTFTNRVSNQNIFIGWNIGHLMSLLLRCGFYIRDGKFKQTGNDISAIVKKGNYQLMPSNTQLLSCHADLFPEQIEAEICRNKVMFDGNIREVNW